MTQEELKIELEELAVRFSEGWHEGVKIDASDIMLLNEAAQALAQPEQEPVQFKCTVIDDAHPNGIPLEQWAKPPQRTWVGLTEDERDHLTGLHLYAVRGQVEAWIEGVDDFAQAIEAKLKEKNT